MAPGEIFTVENIELEMANKDEINAERFNRQAEMKRQQAEVDSATVSLKTNLGIFLVLILLYFSVLFLSSDVLAVIFSILKNMAPIVTGFVNFEKIRSLWSMS
jgi:hypothetical protein